jgi:phosphoserine phosphatase RsbU/P
VVRCQKGMTSEHLGESERDISIDTYIGEAFLTNSVVKVNDTDFLDKPALGTDHSPRRNQIVRPCAHHHRRPAGRCSFRFLPFGQREFSPTNSSHFSQSGGSNRGRLAKRHPDDKLIDARERERELRNRHEHPNEPLADESVPEIPGIALAGICVPASQVGGDYYDYLVRDDDSLDLVIADVSGHNVGAALLMAETRTFIQARARSIHTPAK